MDIQCSCRYVQYVCMYAITATVVGQQHCQYSSECSPRTTAGTHTHHCPRFCPLPHSVQSGETSPTVSNVRGTLLEASSGQTSSHQHLVSQPSTPAGTVANGGWSEHAQQNIKSNCSPASTEAPHTCSHNKMQAAKCLCRGNSQVPFQVLL